MDEFPETESMDILTARIPAALKKWLVELAQREHRSASQQLTVILERAKADMEVPRIVNLNGPGGWKPEE